MTRAVVVAPWRPGDEHRSRLWEFTKAWWSTNLPDLDVITSPGPDGPFNRAAAINEAVAGAGDFDVVLIVDTDSIPELRNVAAAIEVAATTGQMVVGHTRRHMLTETGTRKILDGYTGPWAGRTVVGQTFTDSVSCCVAVNRTLWDAVGGFDELFVGWGREDTAFRIACEATSGYPILCLDGESWHLWHPVSPEARRTSPTRRANERRHQRYVDARWQPDQVRQLLDERHAPSPEVPVTATVIPRILHRTVPADTTDQVEAWWSQFADLHPGWDLRTYREPIDPADWPLTGDLFDRCQNGAQKAGLIRLEALYTHGGIYVDSDVEPHRSLEPLLQLQAFAGWEDETTVPDAVLGATAGHPAFEAMLAKARASIEGGGDAWHSGPGVTTETLPGRPDVLVLPPGAFYPHHYLQKAQAGAGRADPWCFVEHHWHHSWGTDAQRRSIAGRQRS